MKKFRVIFMGTPEFAVPCLAALYEHCDVKIGRASCRERV